MSTAIIAGFVVTAWILVMIWAWAENRPNSLSIVFVVGVIGLAATISWWRVEQTRAARQAATADYAHPAGAGAPAGSAPAGT